MSSTTSARDADSRDSREPGQGEEHDWEWRRRIRANPKSARLYRIGVGVLGAIVVIVGIVLLPFPGPGWLVIFFGMLGLAVVLVVAGDNLRKGAALNTIQIAELLV